MDSSPTRDLAHVVSSTPTIPFDLIFEILSFLPAKSLIRFQYVSKLWFSIIRSKNFGDSLMAMSKTRPRILLYLMHLLAGKRFIFSAPERNNDDDNSSSIVIARHDMTIPDPVYQIKSVPVDGLICFTSDSSSISVCNPTTRQIVKLPDVTRNGRNIHVHLGYDPVENQYKVLCVMMFDPASQQDIQQEHFICTVRSSPKQEWRKIENTIGDSYSNIYEGICINSAIYYGVGQSRIIRFDVRSEKMDQLIKAPEESNISTATLINYNGNLGGVDYVDNNKDLRLWILENAEKHEWSSMTFALPSAMEHLDVISMMYKGVIRSGEPMVFHYWLGSSNSFYVSYFDLNKMRIRDVEIQGVADGDFRRIHGFGDDSELKGLMLCLPGYVENIRFL